MEGLDKDTDTQVGDQPVDAAVDAAGGHDAGSSADERVEQLEAEIATLKDQVVRQAAEFQNYRRRTDQEKQQMADFGKLLVVQQLLDVLDDFRRSLDAAETVDDSAGPEAVAEAFHSLHTGVAMVYGKMLGELAKLGVEQIDAVGKPFDENQHEALMSQPAEEGQEQGQVVAELQTGYRMGERVIRHARVVVTA